LALYGASLRVISSIASIFSTPFCISTMSRLIEIYTFQYFFSVFTGQFYAVFAYGADYYLFSPVWKYWDEK